MNRKWVKLYGFILLLILILIGTFNYIMDPFWTFSHNHKYNSVQKGINERQQKANHMFFTDKKYNTLLLGSSRTTYMNRHSFEPLNVFNFSAAGMRPQEYLTYIDFVIEDCKQPIDTIIIGMDFFGYLDYGLFMFDNASSIVNTTQSIGYRWKILFGFDTLNNSFKNIRDYFKNRGDSDRYNRDLVKTMKIRENLDALKQQILTDVKIYAKSEYSSLPNKDYLKLIQTIKQKYSDKKFIIYTTPISEPLFQEMIALGHYENYRQWLHSLVNVFGEINHFMYRNEISKNYTQYFGDSNHAYPDTNRILAQTIMSNYTKKYKDFGVLLDPTNINEELNKLNALQ